jgi:putative sterol carrier protein
MASGRLKPTTALMIGKIKIKGDMGYEIRKSFIENIIEVIISSY